MASSVLFLASCAEITQEDLTDTLPSPLAERDARSHHVSYSDIETLTKAQNTRTRGYDIQESKIECITNSSNDTLLYIHQIPSGGWTIYSSDTRVPAIVAESTEGSIEELMECESVREWIKWMSEDMEIISKLPKNKLKFTSEEVSSNQAFWKSVSSSDGYVKEKLLGSETRGGSTRIKPILPAGHYELCSSITYNEDYDAIPRLTKTNWHQDVPYNRWCPRKYRYEMNLEISERAPAGCVPIAAAQILYYLHYKLGVPETSPSQAWINGNVETGFQLNLTNYTSEIWDRMNGVGNPEAMLIADIGRRIGVEYHNTYARGDAGKLKDYVFKPYGISCSLTEYNPYLLKTNLVNGYPVFLGATDETGESGHAFIVDRYKRFRQVTVNYYEWVSDNPPSEMNPIMPPSMKRYSDTIYSTPIINAIAMNWGWKGVNNDAWYSLTGDWFDPSSQSQQKNWNKNRFMICNFEPINNN